MKHYRDASGQIYAYELDGSQDHLIGSKTPMSEEEVRQSTDSAQLGVPDIIRGQRNSLLNLSDWTQVLDAPVDQTLWANYRQSLRDIPQQEGFPHNISWPTQPE
jgi:hypothetical protein